MPPRDAEAADMPEMKADAPNVRIEYSGEHKGERGLIMERPLAVRFAARILWRGHPGDERRAVWPSQAE